MAGKVGFPSLRPCAVNPPADVVEAVRGMSRFILRGA